MFTRQPQRGSGNAGLSREDAQGWVQLSQRSSASFSPRSPRTSLWQLGFSKVSNLVYHPGAYPAARAVPLPSDLHAGGRYIHNVSIQLPHTVILGPEQKINDLMDAQMHIMLAA